VSRKPFLLYVKVEMSTGEWTKRGEPTKYQSPLHLLNLWLALRLAAGVRENVYPAEKITSWTELNPEPEGAL